jgi:deoxyhypusine synthase
MHKKVNQVDVKQDQTLKELINNLDETAFTARRLARACKIFEKMVKTEGCTKFLSLAGAMVPAGMQKIIYDLLDLGFIDILITTGANLTHDVAETLGFPHLQGDNEQRDEDLFNKKVSRIYDVYMPTKVYESIEEFIKTLSFKPTISVKDFLWHLGKELPDHPHSILKVCSEKKIPIYCPAFTDCGLAIQVLFTFPETNFNQFQDLKNLIDTAWDAKIAGCCIIGGGVPKNYLFQAMQFSPNSLSYAIQITMDRPEFGGLSGASLEEAISWGKVNKDAEYTTVIADATMVMPLLLSYLKTTCKKK